MREKNDVPNERQNPTLEHSSETSSSETVRRAMTRNPASVTREDSLTHAAELMRDHDCGAIPVVEGRRPVGMITDRDIVMRVVAEKTNPADRRVSEAMTEGVQMIREDESLDRAFETMSQHRIRRLPVVNAEGELTGMLAQADLALDSRQDRRFADTVEDISRTEHRRRG